MEKRPEAETDNVARACHRLTIPQLATKIGVSCSQVSRLCMTKNGISRLRVFELLLLLQGKHRPGGAEYANRLSSQGTPYDSFMSSFTFPLQVLLLDD